MAGHLKSRLAQLENLLDEAFNVTGGVLAQIPRQYRDLPPTDPRSKRPGAEVYYAALSSASQFIDSLTTLVNTLRARADLPPLDELEAGGPSATGDEHRPDCEMEQELAQLTTVRECIGRAVETLCGFDAEQTDMSPRPAGGHTLAQTVRGELHRRAWRLAALADHRVRKLQDLLGKDHDLPWIEDPGVRAGLEDADLLEHADALTGPRDETALEVEAEV